MFTFFTLDVLLKLLQANMLEEPSTEQGGNQNHTVNSRALPSSVAGNTLAMTSATAAIAKSRTWRWLLHFGAWYHALRFMRRDVSAPPLFHHYSRRKIYTHSLLSQLSVRTFSKDPAATIIRAVCLPCWWINGKSLPTLQRFCSLHDVVLMKEARGSSEISIYLPDYTASPSRRLVQQSRHTYVNLL